VHWSDQPYVWHVNDGQEVFVVLDGRVRMRYRKDGAEPLGVARVLVIETEGSL